MLKNAYIIYIYKFDRNNKNKQINKQERFFCRTKTGSSHRNIWKIYLKVVKFWNNKKKK